MAVTSRSFQRGTNKIYNIKRIESITEYLDYIHYFQNLTTFESLWFRGVSKSTYNLIPSVYRKEVWDYDPEEAKNLVDRFIHKAKGFMTTANRLDRWEWYYMMQHYGLPTRLLDWTEGHLVALFFSVVNLPSVSTPCVWILNPFSLNNFSSGHDYIYFSDETTMEEEDKILHAYLNDTNAKLPQYPLAIEPAYTNERVTAQKACFTIHGKVKNGFASVHKQYPDFELVQLRIRTKNAEKIKSQLTLAGITEATLFPDLEGVVRDLRYEKGMSY